MLMGKFLFLFLIPFSSFSQQILQGTAIVIYANTEEIYAGADSKAVYKDSLRDSIGMKCKIRSVGDVYYTCGGTISVDTTFDLFDIANESLKTKGSLNDKILTCEKIIKQKGKSFINVLHQCNLKDTNLFTLVFFGFDESVPYIKRRIVKSIADSIKIEKDDKLLNVAHQALIRCEGLSDDLYSYAREHNELFKNTDPIPSIIDMLEYTFKIHPDDVGPPIDLVHITVDRTEWIYRKDICK
jgi:hypothetical protein